MPVLEFDKQKIDVGVTYTIGNQKRPESIIAQPAFSKPHLAVTSSYAPKGVRADRVLASMSSVGKFRPEDGQRLTSLRPKKPRPPVRQAPPVSAPITTTVPVAAPAVEPPAGAPVVAAPTVSHSTVAKPIVTTSIGAAPISATTSITSPNVLEEQATASRPAAAVATTPVVEAKVATKKVDPPAVSPDVASSALEPLLVIDSVSKAFGSVRAVDAVSLSLHPGEKHALLGENGAGKSTLVKMIYGVLQPDSGTISLDGRKMRIESPSAARSHGIGMVFQHFSTFEALTVAENLAVVLPDRSLRDIRSDVRRIGDQYGLGIEPDKRLASLSAGERQRVEIIRCLLQNPRLLIMDEPTSVLTPQEATALFVVLDRLVEDGCAILYISHRLDDVRAFCTSATVMRRGKVVATCNPREETAASLAEMMIGSTVERPSKPPTLVGGARLVVDNLSLESEGGVALDGVTFSARKGEILGIAGVAGEGQSELFAALSGERTLRRRASIKVDGRSLGNAGPTMRRSAGMAFAPERRVGHSAIGDMRLSENYRLTHHATRMRRKGAAMVREAFDVRAEGKDPFATALSGGNLQKFVIGREIARNPGVLIVEQPTWGVDAGAAATIHEALMDLAGKGTAIVVISQDLDEIFALCDRVAVLHRGTLSEPQVTSEVSAEDLGLLMGGATLAEAS